MLPTVFDAPLEAYSIDIHKPTHWQNEELRFLQLMMNPLW